MDVVDVYGNLPDQSVVILAMGNFNHVSELLTEDQNRLQMQTLSEISIPTVVELVLTYEQPITTEPKLYFSLQVRSSGQYVGVKIEDPKVAIACISADKTIFNLNYSAVDRNPRSQLLAGSLYSLETVFGEQTYIVSWKIQGLPNGDLVIFLPTTWWEPVQNNFCEQRSGIDRLLDRLSQLQFRGFTTQKWCETMPQTSHCQDTSLCGDCFGRCLDISHICYPNLNRLYSNLNGSPSSNFVCGPNQTAPDMEETNLVSFSEPPPTTGTGATWLAIILIFVIVVLLTWGLSTQLRAD